MAMPGLYELSAVSDFKKEKGGEWPPFFRFVSWSVG
jgi:hypothetical protein